MVEQFDPTEELGQIRNLISSIRAKRKLILLGDEHAVEYFSSGGYAVECWTLLNMMTELDQHLTVDRDLAQQGDVKHFPQQWR